MFLTPKQARDALRGLGINTELGDAASVRAARLATPIPELSALDCMDLETRETKRNASAGCARGARKSGSSKRIRRALAAEAAPRTTGGESDE